MREREYTTKTKPKCQGIVHRPGRQLSVRRGRVLFWRCEFVELARAGIGVRQDKDTRGLVPVLFIRVPLGNIPGVSHLMTHSAAYQQPCTTQKHMQCLRAHYNFLVLRCLWCLARDMCVCTGACGYNRPYAHQICR